MPNSDKVYLDDILESIRKIEKYTSGFSYKEFSENELVVDGITRNLEVIGEAVKSLSADSKKAHSAIEWKKIAGLRDILIHEYSGVNLTIIWDVVLNKIPELKKAVSEMVKGIE